MAADENLNLTVSARDQASAALKDVNKNLEDTGKTASDVGGNLQKAGLAIGAAGVGLTAFAKSATDSTVDYTKGIMQMSRLTGESVEETSRLAYVFKRSGVDANETTAIFRTFSKQITENNKNTEEAASKTADYNLKIKDAQNQVRLLTDEQKKSGDKTGEIGLKIQRLNMDIEAYQKAITEATTPLARLGIETKNADGSTKGFNDILLEVSDKFKAMPDGAEKTALAVELFGRKGTELLPILNKGSQAIQELGAQADKLGLTLTSDNISSVTRYIESQKRLQDSTQALKMQVGELTAPVLTAFNTKLSEMAMQVLQSDGALRTASVGVLAFGGPVLSVTGTVLGFVGSVASIPAATLRAGAAFGAWGIAATGAAVALGGLGYSIFDTAAKTGSFTTAMDTWQAKVVSALPIVGQFMSGLAALGGVVFQQEMQQRALKAAHDATTASQEAAKLATDQLTSANLQKEGADLAVEAAQRAYNQAVAQYGPDSLEARQANHNLATATETAKQATEKATQATDEKAKADQEFAKNTEAEQRLKEQANAADQNKGAFDRAAGAVAGFIRNLFDIPAKVNQPQPSFPVAANNPQFAGGVRNFKGGWATVGEEGPELVHLPSGSDVYSNGDSKRLMSGSGATPAAPSASAGQAIQVTVNYTVNGNVIDNDATMRPMAVRMAQLVDQALKGQGVSSVTQLRTI